MSDRRCAVGDFVEHFVEGADLKRGGICQCGYVEIEDIEFDDDRAAQSLIATGAVLGGGTLIPGVRRIVTQEPRRLRGPRGFPVTTGDAWYS